MIDTNEPIAGFAPYQRGYHPMGYLQQIPPLRIVNTATLATESHYFAAELLLDDISKETFIKNFTPNDNTRFWVTCTPDGFRTIQLLRHLRNISAQLQNLHHTPVKIPICCHIHSFTEYLYALIAQADELVADESEQHLCSPENQLLIANSFISKTIDPFYNIHPPF